MCILNITRAVKIMSVNEIRDFTFDNYYKRTQFSKESSYYSVKGFKKKKFVVACEQINRKNT